MCRKKRCVKINVFKIKISIIYYLFKCKQLSISIYYTIANVHKLSNYTLYSQISKYEISR